MRRSRVDGAGQARDLRQPLRDQHLGRLTGHVFGGCCIQIAGVIENEGEGGGLRLGPVQRGAEPGGFPRGHVEQIPLISPERIGRRAADIEIGQRLLIGLRQGRGGGGKIGLRRRHDVDFPKLVDCSWLFSPCFTVGLVLGWSFKCRIGSNLCRYLFTKLQVTVLHLLRFEAGAGQGSTGYGPILSRVQWLRKTDIMVSLCAHFPAKSIIRDKRNLSSVTHFPNPAM